MNFYSVMTLYVNFYSVFNHVQLIIQAIQKDTANFINWR